MKIYFSASIKGGKQLVDTYAKMISALKKYGDVLTEHIGDKNYTFGNLDLPKNVYEKDCSFMKQCDVVVADVTVPSLGVGYELAYLENLHKPIFCLYNGDLEKVSSMISGNEYFKLFCYQSDDDAVSIIDGFMTNLQ